MKNLATYLLICSLIFNLFLLLRPDDIQKPVRVVRVKTQDVDPSGGVSEDTTSFVLDFASKISECDTFLWSVSENSKQVKYTIWFEK